MRAWPSLVTTRPTPSATMPQANRCGYNEIVIKIKLHLPLGSGKREYGCNSHAGKVLVAICKDAK